MLRHVTAPHMEPPSFLLIGAAWSPVQSVSCGAVSCSIESQPYDQKIGGDPAGWFSSVWCLYGNTPEVVCPSWPLPMLRCVQCPRHRLRRHPIAPLSQLGTVHVSLWYGHGAAIVFRM